MVADAIRRVHALVTGRVQGVSFRAGTQHEARRLGLSGWVRNLPDGRVEFEAEGPTADIEALLQWARSGPPAARVDELDVSDVPATRTQAPFTVTS